MVPLPDFDVFNSALKPGYVMDKNSCRPWLIERVRNLSTPDDFSQFDLLLTKTALKQPAIRKCATLLATIKISLSQKPCPVWLLHKEW